MVNKYICGKCGKTFENTWRVVDLKLSVQTFFYSDRRLKTLCPKCEKDAKLYKELNI